MAGFWVIIYGMKKILVSLVLMLLVVVPVRAQELAVEEATESAVATESAALDAASATSSGIVEKQIEEKDDITQPTQEVKNKLEKVLEENPVGDLHWNNFLRAGVVRAVKNGVPVNTVVLILLFPLIVAIVAAARHLIGMRGVGILTPALLSVAFLATGIWAGVGMFLVIIAVATAARILLKRLKLQYLPRMALLLWCVSGGVFATLLLASIYDVSSIVTVGIFPILILILLAETFIDIQVGRSNTEAREIIVQTFLLAILSSLLLAWELVQRVVLLNPEIVFLGVGVFNIFVGRYTGLRLREYLMFRPAIRDDEEE